MISMKNWVIARKCHLKELVEKFDKVPSLAIINTLESPATTSYIKGKLKDAEEVGIKAEVFYFEDGLSPEEFGEKIQALPHDAIIIQLPLHPNYEPFRDEILSYIPPYKDVDGLTDRTYFNPCTPLGIMNFLESNDFKFSGANVTIIGRSELVGKPLARLMLEENATVTICHSHTKDLAQHTLNADLIVCAAGRPNLLTADMVRHDYKQIVIDVGINRVNGKLCGDVSSDVEQFVKYSSPVPGGVGLLTRMSLMENTYIAARLERGVCKHEQN